MTYERQIATAERLISANGEPITIYPAAATPVDADAPHRAKTSAAPYSAVGAFFPYGTVARQNAIMKDGVVDGDEQVLVSAVSTAGVDPRPSDSISRASQPARRQKIISVDTLNVNGEKIMYTLHVRG